MQTRTSLSETYTTKAPQHARSLSCRQLGSVDGSGDAVAKPDWAGDCVERFEAFAGAKDSHISVVEHTP